MVNDLEIGRTYYSVATGRFGSHSIGSADAILWLFDTQPNAVKARSLAQEKGVVCWEDIGEFSLV